jgi:hypothetical protein
VKFKSRPGAAGGALLLIPRVDRPCANRTRRANKTERVNTPTRDPPQPSPGQRDKSALLRLCGNMATAMDDLLMGDSVIDDPPTSSSSPAPGAGGAAAIVAAFDASALAEYVADLAVLVLNASRDDLLLSLLAYPDTLHKCSRFAADASSQSLYLRKDTADTTLTPSSQNGIPLTPSRPPFICFCL